MATGDRDVLMDGSGSRDDERDDTIDPGAESLELRLVLLWGRSGAGTALLRGGMTPNGRTWSPGGAERMLDLEALLPMELWEPKGFDPAHNSAVVGLDG